MHLEKYKAPAVSGVSKHNARVWEGRGFERENIDNSLIGENYNLAPDRGVVSEFVDGRIAALDLKRAPRKDAVRMVEWVVTLPEGERDERAFFESTYRHMAEEYGEENVAAAWVHKDEPNARPHMHFDFVPVTRDGRLSAKEIVNRNHLRQMHPKMQRLVSADLGHEVAFLLPEEEEGRRELSRLDHSDYIAAKDEIAATMTRLECLRQREGELAGEVEELRSRCEQAERFASQPAPETLSESIRTLWTARNDGVRAEELEGEVSGLRERIRALEGQNQRARERVAELDRDLPGLRSRARGLEGSVGAARARVEQLARRVTGYISNVGERMAEVLGIFGVRAYAGQPPVSAMAGEARAASMAMNSRTLREQASRASAAASASERKRRHGR